MECGEDGDPADGSAHPHRSTTRWQPCRACTEVVFACATLYLQSKLKATLSPLDMSVAPLFIMLSILVQRCCARPYWYHRACGYPARAERESHHRWLHTYLIQYTSYRDTYQPNCLTYAPWGTQAHTAPGLVWVSLSLWLVLQYGRRRRQKLYQNICICATILNFSPQAPFFTLFYVCKFYVPSWCFTVNLR